MPLHFIVDSDSDTNATLYVDYSSTTTRDARDLVRNDSTMAFTVEPVTVNEPGDSTIFDADYEATDTFELRVGPIDEAPTGGTFSLDVGGTTTNLTGLDYNITAAALQTPLSAAFVTEGFSACTVTLLNEGVYQIDATTNGTLTTGQLTAIASQLQPACEIGITEVSLGGASSKYQLLLVLRQSAIAVATPATALTTAGVTATTTQAGSLTANKIVTISMDAARTYGGTFSVSATVAGTTQTCGVATPTMSANEFAAVLAGHPNIYFQDTSGTADNVSVTKNGSSFVVEFTGTAGAAGAQRTLNAATVANPSVITTTAAHGYASGQSVTISGSSGTTPSLDGTYTITVISSTTFSIPLNVTASSSPTGTILNTTQPALTAANIDLVAPLGRSGVVDFNTTNLYRYSLAQDTDSFDLPIQIQRTRVSGEIRKIFLSTVTLKKEIIDTSSMTDIPNILTGDNTYTGNNTFTGTVQVDNDFGASGTATIGDLAVESATALGGSLALNRIATATSYTVLTSDCIIGVTSTAAARDITLPAAASHARKIFIVKDESGGAGTNNITVKAVSGTLDGVAAATGVAISTNYGVSRWYSNGTNYFSF